MSRLVWSIVFLLVAGCLGPADSEPSPPPTSQSPSWGDIPQAGALDMELVASGFDFPVAVLHAPGDQFLYVVQKDGRIIITIDGIHLRIPALDISTEITTKDWEQGLLDATFHPDWPDDPRVFVRMTPPPIDNGTSTGATNGTSTDTRPPGNESRHNETNPADDLPHRLRIVEYTYNATTWLFEGPGRTILEVHKAKAQHNAGSLVFGPDGYLYAGIGEGGISLNAQDNSTLLGSIIRIDVSKPGAYGIPPDNPFVGDPDARPEIWQMGVRNPWKMAFDDATGDLWFADVGGSLREEIDVVPADAAGQNFGWGVLEGNATRVDREVNRTPFTPPVWNYAHFEDDDGRYHCAIIGGILYRGDGIPGLYGSYVFGDLCAGTIWALGNDNGTWDAQMIHVAHRGLAAIETDADGEILLINHDFGTVRRLVMAPSE